MHRRAVALIAVVFVASCVVGPLLDQVHVVGGALAYADPWLLGQAWWVAPQFGAAFAGIAAAAVYAQHRFGSRHSRPTPPVRVGQQLVWFVAAYLVTGALWERPWLVFALLAAGLAIRWLADRPDAATINVTVLLAVAGSAYEAALSSVPGTFDYALTGGLPVPVWLPLLYAHGAPLVRTFMKDATRALAGAAT